jgi:hypothetical protein
LISRRRAIRFELSLSGLDTLKTCRRKRCYLADPSFSVSKKWHSGSNQFFAGFPLERRFAERMEKMRSGKTLKRAVTLLDERETVLEQVSRELERALIPRKNQLGHAQNLKVPAQATVAVARSAEEKSV